MKNFQEWCVRMLAIGFMGKDRLVVENEPGTKEKGYDQVLVAGLIGQYPLIYEYNGRNFNIADADFHKKELRGREIWRNLLYSNAARAAAEALEQGEKSIKDFKREHAADKGYLVFEPILPRTYVFDRIMASDSAGVDGIKDALCCSRLVLITGKEAAELTGAGKAFNEKDEKLVRSWESVIGAEAAEEAVRSMKKESGAWQSCKNNGNAYARIAHLINAGAQFCWKKGATGDAAHANDISVIKEYFESNDWEVKEYGAPEAEGEA